MRIAWLGGPDGFLIRGLREAGHQVEAGDAELLDEVGFDALVLDRPDVEVGEVAAAAKAQPQALRVVLIDAARTSGVAALLRAGADVCLARPVSGLELMARLDVHVRSAPRPASRLALKPDRREVEIGGRSIELTGREFAVLRTLAEQPGQVVAASDIIRLAWGQDAEHDPRAVAAYVARLRRKLGDEPRIVSLRGHGYRLDLE